MKISHLFSVLASWAIVGRVGGELRGRLFRLIDPNSSMSSRLARFLLLTALVGAYGFLLFHLAVTPCRLGDLSVIHSVWLILLVGLIDGRWLLYVVACTAPLLLFNRVYSIPYFTLTMMTAAMLFRDATERWVWEFRELPLKSE